MALAATAALAVATAPPAAAQPAVSAQATTDYTVVVETGASRGAAVAAVIAAGGTVVHENDAVGVLTVKAPATGFAQRVSASPAVLGAAVVTPVGRTPGAGPSNRDMKVVEREHPSLDEAATKAKRTPAAPTAGLDPLDDALWGLKLVRSDLARTKQAGDKRVSVGVLDTGVDGTHPDLAPNFDRARSRNFTVDLPQDETGATVDGPCEFRGCVDPADRDDNGHGTHVAGTIAAAANGFGVSGVAPNVTVVNIRGGQDSGFFFVQPVVDALTYGADIGLDVINMSFYVDPWYLNCTSNPADTPEQQLAQRTTIAAITRALDYAHNKGVTLIAAGGNNHEDLGNPRSDATSPNFPAGSAHPRQIDNLTCIHLPGEANHVLSISSLGPSGNKADYSNYGTEQTDLSAPGGYFRDGFGTDWYRTNENEIRSTYPRNVALAEGAIDADGNITADGLAKGVAKACQGTTCGYYQYLQGTSMAAPHAVGVAALVVSQYGRNDRAHPGTLTLDPDRVERILVKTAAQRPCPTPRTVSYENVGRSAEFTATCVGDPKFNGFYGHGIVDAYAAVTRGGTV
ncbi:S8 family serine peptidase [Actinosynnema sp. NPDC020468]|uniref:S8 family serine peptidase n=1 Tax=Actinosynnema sp. NPDC020468 TaxID=3154488 RepID=UPI0033C9F671